ncbi:MAG: hypothetical protein EXR75_13595, partial [Myxococcales bacterium]|nr:hypothetical protein [Myxococcales bacterium]
MTVHDSGDRIDATIARLQGEAALASDGACTAILRHEMGVLEAARGDVEAAEREYFAAFTSERSFREPLEALIHSIVQRGGDPSLGVRLEQRVGTAQGAAETTRALFELASYRADVVGDADSARDALEEAARRDPTSADAWLGLELDAVRRGDRKAQARAIEARVGLAVDSAVKATLMTELAELCVADAAVSGSADGAVSGSANGAVSAALELLEEAAKLPGRGRFPARLALERVARKFGNDEALARALEAQAELIAGCLDAPESAEGTGVPSPVRTPAYAAEAWVRAADLRREMGDAAGAADALACAAECMPDSQFVARLRIAACDAVGDVEGAVECARAQLAAGAAGAVGAAMWVRVALAEEAAGRIDEAIDAYGNAVRLDSRALVAETLRLELLARDDGGARLDGGAQLAGALEAAADRVHAQERPRLWLCAAFVWALRVRDMEASRRALAGAVASGVDATTIARVERMLAAASGDAAAYEAATRALIDARDVDDAQRAALSVELGRVHLERGEEPEAMALFDRVGSGDVNARWMGRALGAFALGTLAPGACAVGAGDDLHLQELRGIDRATKLHGLATVERNTPIGLEPELEL